jgi:hypothetical protein
MDDRQVFPFEEPTPEMLVVDALRATTKTILDALGIDIPPLSDDILLDVEQAFAELDEELGAPFHVTERNTIRQPRNALAHRLTEPQAKPGTFGYREHFAGPTDAFSLTPLPREDRIGWWTP